MVEFFGKNFKKVVGSFQLPDYTGRRENTHVYTAKKFGPEKWQWYILFGNFLILFFFKFADFLLK